MPLSADTDAERREQLTFGQRLADRVAAFGGAWTFIGLFGLVLFAWIALNSLLLAGRAFDPYPYILFNLMLSMLAALQAPVIMMAQNRQAAKDRLAAAHDYEVNHKAELEIIRLPEKLDPLRHEQLARILEQQAAQLGLLTRLLGAGSGGDHARSAGSVPSRSARQAAILASIASVESDGSAARRARSVRVASSRAAAVAASCSTRCRPCWIAALSDANRPRVTSDLATSWAWSVSEMVGLTVMSMTMADGATSSYHKPRHCHSLACGRIGSVAVAGQGAERTHRFAELRRAIPGITEHVIT